MKYGSRMEGVRSIADRRAITFSVQTQKNLEITRNQERSRAEDGSSGKNNAVSGLGAPFRVAAASMAQHSAQRRA